MRTLVDTQRCGHVLVATLSRPPVNALDDTLIAQLHAVLDTAIADADVAVLHIRSSQRVFCAGAALALIRACFATVQGPEDMTQVVRHMQRELAARLGTIPKAALAANKRCIAAQSDPARDGYAEEIFETRRLYDHPETRSRVNRFLARNAAKPRKALA